MTDPVDPNRLSGLTATRPTSETPAHWQRRVIQFVDVVESVRLIQQDEEGVIDRWRRFVSEVRSEVLPLFHGGMVKSLGDGMLLEFDGAGQAVAAAHEMQRRIQAYNIGVAAQSAIWLRIGVHVARVVRDEFDIYGAGVNLCARIAGAAQPGEVLVSADVRSSLLLQLDGEIEDLGFCFLKHVEGSHRLFKVLAPGGLPRFPRGGGSAPLQPRLAIAPVRSRGPSPPPGLPETLADNLIAALSRSSHWLVTSRLSTAALSGRELDFAQIGALLGVEYLVACTLTEVRGHVEVETEIIEAASAQVVWSGVHRAAMHQLLGAEDPLLHELANDVAQALLQRQIKLAHQAALPTLAGYTVLLSAIATLHSLGPADMLDSRAALEHLVDRYPRSSEAQVWLAKWHFLQLAQARGPNLEDSSARARSLLARALDETPDHALALALSGHMASFVDGDVTTAEGLLNRSVEVGPNESLASLFLAELLTNSGRSAQAVQAIERASELSPVDPLGYYYDLFAASAYSAAGEHQKALDLALRSLRQNALHLSTWIQVIIEQVHTDRLDAARANARRYLALRPKASVQRYFDRHPARDLPLARANADALLAAGLPL